MGKSRENRIAELRSACGCKEGMIALVIGVAGYGLALRYFPIGDSTLHLVVLGIATGLGSAVVGKLFGLLVANARLRRLLNKPRGASGAIWSSPIRLENQVANRPRDRVKSNFS